MVAAETARDRPSAPRAAPAARVPRLGLGTHGLPIHIQAPRTFTVVIERPLDPCAIALQQFLGRQCAGARATQERIAVVAGRLVGGRRRGNGGNQWLIAAADEDAADALL